MREVKVTCPECNFPNYLNQFDDLFCDKCGRELEEEFKEAK